MTDGPRNPLDERLRELSQDAQTEYTEDPVGAVLGYLLDREADFDESIDSLEFIDGYGYAIYHVEEAYIRHASGFECECRYPFPEKLSDGEWHCGDCQVTLVDSSETVLEARDA